MLETTPRLKSMHHYDEMIRYIVIYPTHWRLANMLSTTLGKGQRWSEYGSRIAPLHGKIYMKSLEKSHEKIPRSQVLKPLNIEELCDYFP